jgi:hypothetical protein
MEKTIANLIIANMAPRCKATAKRTRQRCRGPAVKGWTVCRCHGAGGGAPTGKRHGQYKHGQRTRAAIAERRALSKLIREARASLADLE